MPNFELILNLIDLEKVKVDVEDLKTYAQNIDLAVRDINEKTLEEIRESIQTESEKRLELEYWGRKWNLVLRGVQGVSNEGARETEKKVREFLKGPLGLLDEFGDSVVLQAAHRLPGGDADKRNIIVRFSSIIDRDEVMDAARKLKKGSGYSVSPDLPPCASALRAKLLNERKEMPVEVRGRTKLVYFKTYPFVGLKTVEKKSSGK